MENNAEKKKKHFELGIFGFIIIAPPSIIIRVTPLMHQLKQCRKTIQGIPCLLLLVGSRPRNRGLRTASCELSAGLELFHEINSEIIKSEII